MHTRILRSRPCQQRYHQPQEHWNKSVPKRTLAPKIEWFSLWAPVISAVRSTLPDRRYPDPTNCLQYRASTGAEVRLFDIGSAHFQGISAVSYTHLRAH